MCGGGGVRWAAGVCAHVGRTGWQVTSHKYVVSGFSRTSSMGREVLGPAKAGHYVHSKGP